MLYLIAFVMPIILMAVVYVYNWQNRLPIKQVLLPFSLGVLAVLIYICWILFDTGQMDGVSHKPDTLIQNIPSVMLDAAMPEELIKWIVLSTLLIIGRGQKLYDSHYNIIMCAVSISMGFAALENMIYLLGSDHMVRTVVARSLMSVPGHCCNAIWMGYFCAIAKFEPSKRWFAIPICLIVPIMTHFTHNYSIDIPSYTTNVWLDCIALLWIAIFDLGVCILSFKLLKKTKNLYSIQPEIT